MANYQIPRTLDVCKNCRFWSTDTSDFSDLAECRRLPPVRSDDYLMGRPVHNPVVTMRERGAGLWPMVAETSGCGEFARSVRAEGTTRTDVVSGFLNGA